MKSLLISLAVLTGIASHAYSDQTVTVIGDKADRPLMPDGFDGSASGATMRTGFSWNQWRNGVLVFQLPDISATDILNVTLSVYLDSLSGTPTFGTDLYAIGVRPEKDVLATEGYAGSLDTSSGVVLLQSDFITPTDSVGRITTSADGSIDLTGYIISQLESGKAGQYLFLRLSPDIAVAPENIVGYNIATADNTDLSKLPELVFTYAIPEPSHVALGATAVALLAALAVRRRKK